MALLDNTEVKPDVREDGVAVRGSSVLLIASEITPAKYVEAYVTAMDGTVVGTHYFDDPEAPAVLLDKASQIDFAVVENDDPVVWLVPMHNWIRALADRGIPIIIWSDHIPEDVHDLVLATIPFWPASAFTLLETVEKFMPALFATLAPRDPQKLLQQVDDRFWAEIEHE